MQIETGREENEFEEDDDAEEPLPAETNGSVSDLSLVEEMRLVPKDPSVCILQSPICSLILFSELLQRNFFSPSLNNKSPGLQRCCLWDAILSFEILTAAGIFMSLRSSCRVLPKLQCSFSISNLINNSVACSFASCW